jgi:xanthine dehydrogenase accessory factor
MGSRRTHAHHMERLREAGVPQEHLARLHSPIGLDLGAHTAKETAISIAAEIIAHTHEGSGTSLTWSSGPIHHHKTPARERTSAGDRWTAWMTEACRGTLRPVS